MIRTLSNSSPEAKNFLKFIREELHNNKVKLAFSRTRKVRFSHGVYAAGYFLVPTPRKWGVLRVGTGNRKPIIRDGECDIYCAVATHSIGCQKGKRING